MRLLLFFLTGIDIARIFNSFFFERQQCVVWKLGHNLGFVRDPFLLVRAQLPIWDTTCAATITMAPSDRQDKKPKDASPLTLNSTEKLCQPLYLHGLRVQSRCSLTCTPLTPTKTPGPGLLTRCCVVYCIMQWWSDTVPRQRSKTRGQERRAQVATRLCRDWKNCGFIFRTVSQPNYQPEFNKNPTRGSKSILVVSST